MVGVRAERDPLRCDILGPLRACRGEAELALGPVKQRAVLAVLAINANRPVAITQIVDAVWGEEPPENGPNVVQKHIAGLRRVLEPERSPRTPGSLLTLTGAGYLLSVAPECLDAEVFGRLVAQARSVAAEGRTAEASAILGRANGLWRGEALAGLSGAVFDAARDRLTEGRAAALETWAELELRLGRHVALVPRLLELVADYPLREQLRYLLILCLYRSGRQAEALAAFREARRFLAEEFGVEPGERLQQLHRGILRGDPEHPVSPGQPPAPAPTADGVPLGPPAPASPPTPVAPPAPASPPTPVAPPAPASPPAPVSPSPACASAPVPAQPAVAHLPPTSIAPEEAGPAQAGPGQTGAADADPWQAGPAQTGLGQADPWQADPWQAGPLQAGLAQAGLAQAPPVRDTFLVAPPPPTFIPAPWAGPPAPVLAHPVGWSSPTAPPNRWAVRLGRTVTIAVPMLTFGVAAWAVIGFYAARRRSKAQTLAAVGHLGLLVGSFALLASGPEDITTPGQVVGVLGLLVAWCGGTAHAAALAVTGSRRGETIALSMPDIVALERRAKRDQARQIAASRPDLARQLRIGRPDLPRAVDDGGLVSVNEVPEWVWVQLPGVTPEQARRIVSDRLAGNLLTSVDDLVTRHLLPTESVRELRDLLIVLS